MTFFRRMMGIIAFEALTILAGWLFQTVAVKLLTRGTERRVEDETV